MVGTFRSCKGVGAIAWLAVLGCFSCGGEEDGGRRAHRPSTGTYVVAELFGHEPADEARLMATEMMVDLEAETVTFELHDGSQIEATMALRQRLVTCCCTMSSCESSSAWDLSPDPLEIVSMQLAAPILFSNPGRPAQVVLREDDGSNQLDQIFEVKHISFAPSP